VDWALADHMRTELIEAVLSSALLNRLLTASVIFHTDMGSQNTSRNLADFAKANRVRLYVGRTGECLGL
jgi:transposase InsO family protein